MKILITGCAGFLGFHLCEKILKKEQNFIKNKGKFIVHLPKPKIL